MTHSPDTPATPEGDAISRAAEVAITRAISRLQVIHDYAGRPEWDHIVAEEMRAALDHMRAQAKAEGRKEGVEEYWRLTFNGMSPHEAKRTVLAAAEKEVGHG